MKTPHSLRTYFDLTGRNLHVDGVDVERLVSQYRSPLYVYDLSILRQKYDLLRSAMPPHLKIFYAVKSNPNPALIRVLLEKGCGFDAASIGELYLLSRLKVPGNQILFTGPGKRDEELAFALSLGIRSFNCESTGEILRLNQIAEQAGLVANIGLRIHTESAIEETTPIIGGHSIKKFGVDEAQIDGAVDLCAKLPCIRLRGVHVFNASQILDHQALAENTRSILHTARELASMHHLKLDYIDVGGGLGIPYDENEKELDIVALGKLFDDIKSKESEIDWILEPGRYLSGECGILLTKVIDVKKTSGHTFVITDAGINTFLRPALVGQNHPVVAANRMDEEATHPCTLVGPLCTSLDTIGNEVLLPEMHVGDTLAFFNAGAYGFTESMPYFLSHPIPAEIVIEKGLTRVSRVRQEPVDYLESLFTI